MRGAATPTRHPRPVPAGSRHGRRAPAWAGAAALLVLALLIAACGSTPGPSASASAPASPSQTGSGGPGASGAPAPSPTQWPTPVVETVLALAGADGEVGKATDDLAQAADTQDLEAIWGAADGLVKLLEDMSPAVERIADHPATADLAASYGRALPDMIGGATLVRDSIRNGDAAGIATGSAQLARGIEAYQETRGLLGPIAERALLMKRLLVK